MFPQASEEDIESCLTNVAINDTIMRGFAQIQTFNIYNGLLSVNRAVDEMKNVQECLNMLNETGLVDFNLTLTSKLGNLVEVMDYFPHLESIVRKMERSRDETEVVDYFKSLFEVLLF